MREQHGPTADRHFDPHWWPPTNAEQPDDKQPLAQDLNRKTDPDATDEYPCLSGSDEE